MRMLFSRIDRILEGIGRWLAWISGIMFALIMFVFVRETFGRYLFNSPFRMTDDLTAQFMLLGVFWATAYIISVGGFPRIDLIYNRFPTTIKGVVDLLSHLGGLVFLVVVFKQTLEFAADAVALDMKATTPLETPLIISYGGMLLGTLFFALSVIRQTVRTAVNLFRGSPEPAKAESVEETSLA